MMTKSEIEDKLRIAVNLAANMSVMLNDVIEEIGKYGTEINDICNNIRNWVDTNIDQIMSSLSSCEYFNNLPEGEPYVPTEMYVDTILDNTICGRVHINGGGILETRIGVLDNEVVAEIALLNDEEGNEMEEIVNINQKVGEKYLDVDVLPESPNATKFYVAKF